MGALIFSLSGERYEGAPDEDAILLVERAGEPLKGYWSLPGGLLETGERLEEAVCREVREETGLMVAVDYRFDLFERIMRDGEGRAEYHYVLVDYVCKIDGGEMIAGDDVSRVEWVRCTNLRDYKITSGTMEAVERAYREHPRRGSAAAGGIRK